MEKEGHVLNILVQRQRDKSAGKAFLRKLLKECQDLPRAVIIDQLKCYGSAGRIAGKIVAN